MEPLTAAAAFLGFVLYLLSTIWTFHSCLLAVSLYELITNRFSIYTTLSFIGQAIIKVFSTRI
jgi:hypothetical protein